MGSIKDKALNKDKGDDQTFILTEQEFKYLKAINQTRQNIDREFQGTMTAYLDYIATTRLEFPVQGTRQYEIDLNDLTRELKVQKLPEPEA